MLALIKRAALDVFTTPCHRILDRKSVHKRRLPLGSNITESESLLLRAIWPKTFKADVVQELGLDEYVGQAIPPDLRGRYTVTYGLLCSRDLEMI